MKALKTLFAVLLATAMVFGFASCSDDDDDEVSVAYKTVEFIDVSSISDGTYSTENENAADTNAKEKYWVLKLSGSNWELYRRLENGFYGTQKFYNDHYFYKGTFTSDNDKITLTKTHHADISDGFEKWVEYTVSTSNWATGTLADPKLSISFPSAELNYKAATEQWVITLNE